MNILPFVLPAFILAIFIVVIYKIEFRKPRNKVHFYVARDKHKDSLYLWLGKPIRGYETWHSCIYGARLFDVSYFKTYSLKLKDFQNLKWEDEPVEVLLNLE